MYVSEDAGRAEIAAAAKAAACVRDVLRYHQPPKQRFQPAFAGSRLERDALRTRARSEMSRGGPSLGSGYAKISRHFKAALQAPFPPWPLPPWPLPPLPAGRGGGDLSSEGAVPQAVLGAPPTGRGHSHAVVIEEDAAGAFHEPSESLPSHGPGARG